ncbi:(2Fe-2S)-binding protein [Bacteroidota bacterium]
MKTKISLQVNGNTFDLQVDPETPLLYVLRNQLELNGPKYGCGEELCGACMVLIDDFALSSCKITVGSVAGKSITTIEGLIDENGELHPVQQAFIKEQAAQCGYCLNGMVISTVSMVRQNLIQDEELVRSLLQKNLCRCGTHTRILKAIASVANTVETN